MREAEDHGYHSIPYRLRPLPEIADWGLSYSYICMVQQVAVAVQWGNAAAVLSMVSQLPPLLIWLD